VESILGTLINFFKNKKKQCTNMRDEIVEQPVFTDRDTTVKREVKKRYSAELIYECEQEPDN